MKIPSRLFIIFATFICMFIAGCVTLEYIPAYELKRGLDLRPYAEENFLITPYSYSGVYTSVGIVDYKLMPSKGNSDISLARRWRELSLETQHDLENSKQMIMYALAIKQLYPQYKNIICQIDAVGINDVFERKVTDKWLSDFEEYLIPIYSRMCESISLTDSTPKFCARCSNCEYYMICPLMQDLNKLKINPIDSLVGKNLNYLAQKYLEYSSVGKIAAKNQTITKDILVKLFKDIDSNYIDEEWGTIKYSNNRIHIKLK